MRKIEVLYWRQYGSSLNWEDVSPIFLSIIKTMKNNKNDTKINYMTISEFRISYIKSSDLNLFFFMITDLTDKSEDIEPQIKSLKEEFLELFAEIVPKAKEPSVFKSFNPISDKIHKNLRPKIALVGFSGVGKTSITRLIRAEEIPMTHVPTMTGDIVSVKIGKLYFNLWDFAGQESFSFLWPDFIQDSDAVLIITDSQLENIDESKFFIDLIKDEVPNARCGVIANKQDLPNSMEPKEVSRILGIPAYGMIAIEENNRAKMIKIIANIMDISEQVSPLLKPLIERDKNVNMAEKCLESGDYLKAADYLTKAANLSLELGDDSEIGKELLEKAKIIRSKLGVEDSKESPEIKLDKEKLAKNKDIRNELNKIETELADLEQQRQQGIISEKIFNEKNREFIAKQKKIKQKFED
ncbi:MAG: GTP-binding protein [Candidatus Lokiarchaeota archaeon]|nr:GTP-binding protein [Candidatus Lokiarchaeota archaeon]